MFQYSKYKRTKNYCKYFRILSDTDEPMEMAPARKYVEQTPLMPPRVPPSTPATMSAESSPIPKRRRLAHYIY